MEKQSGSRPKQSSSSRPPTTTDDHNPQVIKFPSQIQSHIQNYPFTQTQPFTQEMDLSQIQMSGASNSQKIQCLEQLKDQLAQAAKEITTLHKKIREVHANRTALEKYIEGEEKTMNELIEKQNISGIHRSGVQEQTAVLRKTLAGFKNSGNDLNEFYNSVILKNDEKIKELKERLNDQNEINTKEFSEQLQSIDNKLVQTRMRYQQSEEQDTIMTKTIDEMSGKQEELDRIIAENQQRHDKKMNKLVEIGNDIDANLTIEQEEKLKLLARHDKSSNEFEKLSAEFQMLQEQSAEHQKQMGNLESTAQELRKWTVNLKSELDEVKSTYLAVVSERDLEIADHRKQLQDLSAEHTQTMNKLSKINSNNEKLSDAVAKAVQRNGELKIALLNKKDEMDKLVKAQDNALTRNKELAEKTQHLSEELLAQKKLLLDTEADLRAHDAAQEKNGEKVSNLRTKLAIAKQELQKKANQQAKLRTEITNEEVRSIKVVKEFQWDIELKNKKLAELKRIEGNLRVEEERVALENERKLQQLNNLSAQCQRAGHEKLIKEQNIKIDLLRHQVQAEKLEHKQDNILKTETEREEREKREAQEKEMKSKIENIEKAIFDTKELLEDLKNIMKKAQTSTNAQSIIVQETLNSSELLGLMFAKRQSIPSSSTPEHSPRQNQRAEPFGSFSDLSSIEGSDIFEAARRNYAAFLQSNKTDSAKLGQDDVRDIS